MARSTKNTTPAVEAEVPKTIEEGITLTGRLCADPVLRHTASGKAVSTIRIAVNDGAEGAEASFHSVVVWGKTAEAVCQYLTKGRLVEVSGRSQERSYTASDDTERTITEIVAWRVHFLSRLTASATSKEVA